VPEPMSRYARRSWPSEGLGEAPSQGFLGYCLWVCLKQKLKVVVADSIIPARTLESLRSILMVEVWFNLRNGGQLCLPRITEAEPCSANQAISRKSLF
jgi:hypothetical protein